MVERSQASAVRANANLKEIHAATRVLCKARDFIHEPRGFVGRTPEIDAVVGSQQAGAGDHGCIDLQARR
jgi:hypothetical protein